MHQALVHRPLVGAGGRVAADAEVPAQKLALSEAGGRRVVVAKLDADERREDEVGRRGAQGEERGQSNRERLQSAFPHTCAHPREPLMARARERVASRRAAPSAFTAACPTACTAACPTACPIACPAARLAACPLAGHSFLLLEGGRRGQAGGSAAAAPAARPAAAPARPHTFGGAREHKGGSEDDKRRQHLHAQLLGEPADARGGQDGLQPIEGEHAEGRHDRIVGGGQAHEEELGEDEDDLENERADREGLLSRGIRRLGGMVIEAGFWGGTREDHLVVTHEQLEL